MIKTTQIAADRAFDEAKTVLPAEVARGVYIENPPGAEALKLMHWHCQVIFVWPNAA